jgi:radical SAM superfamily enzyme YgiQ (UPF0313 family)
MTPRILLVSTYEMGHQPLALASAAAALRNAGYEVACHDVAIEALPAGAVANAAVVGISVPMHTAARLGIEVARRVRELNLRAHIAFYGLYATPLADVLRQAGLADSVVGGEFEAGLVRLANSLAAGDTPSAVDLAFDRQQYPVPDRNGLPPLDRYARLSIDGELRLAGYVEATRGCAHTCTHCPITPVYSGRLRLVQPETVLADIGQQVAMGAQHITFGDPDFLNATAHSLAIVRELNRRHPGVTFDATIKVEHLVEHEALLPGLRDAGCLFITSAFESTNDAILGRLQKGHARADMERALAFAERERLTIRPTWVAFTPWTTAADYLELLAFVEEHGLVGAVQAVQFGLRLLLPPGSPLVPEIASEGQLGPFDDNGLTFTWTNADPRMDTLQREVAAIVEAAAHHGDHVSEPPELTFAKVRQAAFCALEGRAAPLAVSRPAKAVPGLTESWFC